MGLFCVNLHFRTTDDKALSASLDRRKVDRYRVVSAKNGWTSLFEEQASQQDDSRIRDLARGLSEDLHVAAIAFMVHDSDIACYWLYENGQLLDEYNSCPNYFDDDDDGPPSPSGGRTDVLLRYCRTGVHEDELAATLRGESLFAENVIDALAQALGIARERALADYRDGGQASDGAEGSDDEGDDDSGDPQVSPRGKGLTDQLAKMLGFGQQATAVDPQALALVQAAASDDSDEIARLLAAGVPVDAEAPAPLPGGQPMAGLGQLFPGGVPKIAMTPLLAAIVNKRRRATERLLDGGADPNRMHGLFGTPVHAATGIGEVELLQLLIDRGGNVNARDGKGQTPLQVVANGRATRDRLAQTQAMMKSMGVKLPPGLADKLRNVVLPTAGWEACERLLKAQAAR